MGRHANFCVNINITGNFDFMFNSPDGPRRSEKDATITKTEYSINSHLPFRFYSSIGQKIILNLLLLENVERVIVMHDSISVIFNTKHHGDIDYMQEVLNVIDEYLPSLTTTK